MTSVQTLGNKYLVTVVSVEHDKTCGPSEDSDQPAYLRSLIRVFAVSFMGSSLPEPSSSR